MKLKALSAARLAAFSASTPPALSATLFPSLTSTLVAIPLKLVLARRPDISLRTVTVPYMDRLILSDQRPDDFKEVADILAAGLQRLFFAEVHSIIDFQNEKPARQSGRVGRSCPPKKRGHSPVKDSVLVQLAVLKAAPVDASKARWRKLFDTEPPAYNRRFLENRLAYRIQELACGGLSQEILDRLKAVAAQHADKDPGQCKARPTLRPVTGTKLIRSGSWPTAPAVFKSKIRA
jgi:hypothetical protein